MRGAVFCSSGLSESKRFQYCLGKSIPIPDWVPGIRIFAPVSNATSKTSLMVFSVAIHSVLPGAICDAPPVTTIVGAGLMPSARMARPSFTYWSPRGPDSTTRIVRPEAESSRSYLGFSGDRMDSGIESMKASSSVTFLTCGMGACSTMISDASLSSIAEE